MPADESSSSGGDAFRDQRLPGQLECCRVPNCVHQLHQLVYCYYGFRPFLDNAQVQLSEGSARASPPAEEARSRAGQSRRRPGRGQSASAGRSGGRSARGRASAGPERSAPSRSSTPTSGQRAEAAPWLTEARPAEATPRPTEARPAVSGQPARTCAQDRAPTVQKPAKTAARCSAAAAPARGSSPNPAATAAPPTTHQSPLLPTPSSAKKDLVPNSSRCRAASQTPRVITASASAPVLHAAQTPPPPPPAPATPEQDRHLAAILDRLSLLTTPPGELPAFVRVPPPQANAVFWGSRSHGSLEVELGRCRFSRSTQRRRHHSGGVSLPETEEVGGGATWDTPLACCPGGRGHRDSYDPRLDVPPAGEERTREQVRSERLLKNFNMFRDWDYVPLVTEPAVRSEAIHRRRAASVDSTYDSDGDGDLNPQLTVTICHREGGVFHYIPAQRLLKSATAAGDVTDRHG